MGGEWQDQRGPPKQKWLIFIPSIDIYYLPRARHMPHPSVSHSLVAEMGINTSQCHRMSTMTQVSDKVPGEAAPA